MTFLLPLSYRSVLLSVHFERILTYGYLIRTCSSFLTILRRMSVQLSFPNCTQHLTYAYTYLFCCQKGFRIELRYSELAEEQIGQCSSLLLEIILQTLELKGVNRFFVITLR